MSILTVGPASGGNGTATIDLTLAGNSPGGRGTLHYTLQCNGSPLGHAVQNISAGDNTVPFLHGAVVCFIRIVAPSGATYRLKGNAGDVGMVLRYTTASVNTVGDSVAWHMFVAPTTGASFILNASVPATLSLLWY